MKAPFLRLGSNSLCIRSAVSHLRCAVLVRCFVPAMIDELGWQRASLGGAFSLYSVVYTSFTLLSGKLTDSLGPRRVIGVGGILLGIGLVATSQMSSQWQLFFWFGIVAALGMSTAYIPCNMTVVKWFRRKRGLALGLASSGASCGILAVPLLSVFIIEQINWRMGLLIFGLGLLLITNIAARFMVSDPAQMALSPDGANELTTRANSTSTIAEPPVTTSRTLREARRTRAFWMLLIGCALTMTTLGVPFVHLVSFARDIGLSDLRGAIGVSIIGLFSLTGSIILGALSDRCGRKAMFVTAYVSQILAFVLFFNADSAATIYVAAAFFGIFYGGFASLYPALVGDLFGPSHAGAIGGFIVAGGGILGGWGPALAGYLRDVNGTYDAAFGFCVFAAGCAVVLFAFLPKQLASERRHHADVPNPGNP